MGNYWLNVNALPGELLLITGTGLRPVTMEQPETNNCNACGSVHRAARRRATEKRHYRAANQGRLIDDRFSAHRRGRNMPH